jgi:phosphoribosylamine--glycine ligase
MTRPRILIVGSGGREHALAWRIAQDSTGPELFIAPGNPGTATLGTNVAIAATDLDALVAWSVAHRPDLVVVGPEAPLCAGLVDALARHGIRAFGPGGEAARLEGSKVFAKDIMEKGGVPTAASASFTDFNLARDYISARGAPLVVKADGLAAGKGVTVCTTPEQALAAVEDALVREAFGHAGRRVLIEEFLDGEEASILALIDGEHVVLLDSAQDHKRVGDGDTGPNTGGMGAYSPAPVATPAVLDVVREQVFARTLAELRRRDITFKGVLYAGIMLTSKGPKVLEFNVRFGDPETQAILARWDGDLLPALQACVDGTLTEAHVRWKPEAAVCVVMAAGGYPGDYAKGDRIAGLDEAHAIAGAQVFHAGTAMKEGHIVTAGGRVLGVTASGADLTAAVQRAYAAVAKIHFDGQQFRRDIAWRALPR